MRIIHVGALRKRILGNPDAFAISAPGLLRTGVFWYVID